ncbi:MAG: hypothetical protein Q8P35_01670 [Candidatus Yanofskybacteria bacterium]|nr:hypothetical protein [Candidatus Yanofskybacteria bacterium]
MATNKWRCEKCLSQFSSDPGDFCPKCKSEDVFPFRFFRCNGCQAEGDQTVFFQNLSADPDPIEEKEEGHCPDCGSNAIVQLE